MKVLLSLIKGLLRLIKGLSFKALLRSYSPWIAELPYPLLIQSNGWFEPQPRTTIEKRKLGFLQCLRCVITMFHQFWRFWGSGVLRGHFEGGGMQNSLLFLAYPRLIQGLSFKRLLSPYSAFSHPTPTPKSRSNHSPKLSSTPGNSPFFLKMIIVSYPWLIHGLSRHPPASPPHWKPWI